MSQCIDVLVLQCHKLLLNCMNHKINDHRLRLNLMRPNGVTGQCCSIYQMIALLHSFDVC